MGANSKGTILIVEDVAGYRRVYQDALEANGYEVLDTDDGIWGLQLALDERPDLILLDLILPGMHGFDVLKEIRSNSDTASIPVIVFSALGEGKDIRKAMELGANDYAVKGLVSPQEMLAKIRVILSGSSAKEPVMKYHLAIRELMEDASRLAQDLKFENMLACPHCHGKMVLELFPDSKRTPGNWFSAHFVCSQCEAGF